jgi:hypothetical protein
MRLSNSTLSVRVTFIVFVGLMSLVLTPTFAVSSAAAREPAEKQKQEVRLGGRAPASPVVLPRVEPPVVPTKPPRWRLMGNCRNDVGNQQSLSGIGYGNCPRN